MTCSCYFSDLLSSHSLCSRRAGPLTVHPAGRGSHLQAFSLLSFHQEKPFAQIAIQVIPSLPSGFITRMSALTTLPHSGTSNPTPPGSSCLLPFFFLHNNIVISNMLCIILKSLISASTLRHNIVYDNPIGQKSVKILLRGSVKLFLLHELFLHCCSFKSHDV